MTMPGAVRASIRVLDSPLGSFAVALAVYGFVALTFGRKGLGQSDYPYFVYLADAFLHGQMALVSVPTDTLDLVLFQGKTYLYWPPFPALMLTPLVALWGLETSDGIVHLLAAALNVGLVSLLLKELGRQKIATVSSGQRAWITVFFAFGTVYFTLAPYANVWHTGQVIGLGLSLAGHIVGLRFSGWRGMFTAGVLAGLAFLTRNPLLLSFFWLAWYCFRREWAVAGVGRAAGSVCVAALPIAAAVTLYGVYNYARFGSALDAGLAYHNMSGFLRADFDRYGAFSLHYLPINLHYYLAALPYLAFLSGNAATEFWMGGSLFLMSPLFFAGVWGITRDWERQGWALAVACIVGMVPALLLMGTGAVQFGPRYTIDIAVPLLVATAIGVERLPSKWLPLLVLVSIELYFPGTLALGRALPHH